LPGTQHVGVLAAVRPVCFGLAAAPMLHLHVSGSSVAQDSHRRR
jgi:hypothetical protein